MFLFLTQVFAFDDKCVAPLISPPPIAGKELKFVQVLTRHGARAPLSAYLPPAFRGHWLCDSEDAIAGRVYAAPVEHYRRIRQTFDMNLVDYKPNCRAGDLLLTGMQQHKNLGEFYHKYLFENHKLFDSLPVNPEEIYVRCTDVERTLRSAESFLYGIFPTQSPNEIIDIVSDTSDTAILRTNAEWCQDLKQVSDKWYSSDEFLQWVDKTWEVVKDLGQVMGITEKSGVNVNNICDFVSTHFCDDKRLPAEATEEVQKTCLNASGSYIIDYYKSNSSVPASYTMRELVRVADLHATGKKPLKFSLMSSHDTTVTAALVFLNPNINMYRIPPYASHLSMELWKGDGDDDFTVRFAINGEVVNLAKLDNATEAKYSQFKEAYSEMNDYCKEIKV
ncbi:histidine acid phosphatase [Histomonas meleagridis]|uniref:histidine acid phosphatase n=1 Tax=Histomonas meleagridis TaxID=135588 RepID=UPI00355A0AE1|nr:histidine acid phosphatase [Histomonas meleagridis]KAH0800700.1 histidine acid phosphatase [Histomonas meleagridis]